MSKIFSQIYCINKNLPYLCTALENNAPIKFGVVVQLVRIPACHAGGRGFESRPYRQKAVQEIELLFCIKHINFLLKSGYNSDQVKKYLLKLFPILYLRLKSYLTNFSLRRK